MTVLSLLTMEESENIIAAASISLEMFTIDSWGISWVAVHPDLRQQGLGQKIVAYCLHEISGRITTISTAILATLLGQTKLYERIGFTGSTKDHENGLIMTKIIYPIEALIE